MLNKFFFRLSTRALVAQI